MEDREEVKLIKRLASVLESSGYINFRKTVIHPPIVKTIRDDIRIVLNPSIEFEPFVNCNDSVKDIMISVIAKWQKNLFNSALAKVNFLKWYKPNIEDYEEGLPIKVNFCYRLEFELVESSMPTYDIHIQIDKYKSAINVCTELLKIEVEKEQYEKAMIKEKQRQREKLLEVDLEEKNEEYNPEIENLGFETTEDQD